MKKGKPKNKSKAKPAKKNRSPEAAIISQPSANTFSPTRVLAGWSANSQRSSLDLVGEEVVKQLNRLVELAGREDPTQTDGAEVGQVIERVVNHLVEILQTIEKQTPNPALRKVVQDQMVYSARRFSDAAFGVVTQTPHEASKIMTLSLVKFITGQCDNLKKACADNPQTFRWIAEQNVFWPSIRAIHNSFRDGFDKTKEALNLGAGLPINREPKRAPDLRKAACQEAFRFLIHARTPDVVFTPALPRSGKEKKKGKWEKVSALPALPTPSKEPEILDVWKGRLSLYLEGHKKRLLQSTEFQYARGGQKVQRKHDNESLVWARIKDDCKQSLETLLSS